MIESSNKNADDDNNNKKEERIYIGGIDPSRLTVDQVLQRLEQLLVDIEIPTHSLHKGRTFCQFDAHVRNKTNASSSSSSSPSPSPSPSPSSALEIVKKHFHHVVWKGCKLQVERARLHLLDRLAQERRERDLQLQQQQQQPRETATTAKTSSSMGRYMRIRKRHGQEAYKVDTKPYSVEDWESLDRMMKKKKIKSKKLELKRQQLLQQQRQQQQQQQKGVNKHKNQSLEKPKSLPVAVPDRAVHLRLVSSVELDDDNETNQISPFLVDDDDDQDDEQSSTSNGSSSSTSSDSSSDSDSSSSSDMESSDSPSNRLKNDEQAGGTYVWSSDDEDEDADNIHKKDVKEKTSSTSSSNPDSSSTASKSSTSSEASAASMTATNLKQGKPSESLLDSVEPFPDHEEKSDSSSSSGRGEDPKNDHAKSGEDSSTTTSSTHSENQKDGLEKNADDAALFEVDHDDRHLVVVDNEEDDDDVDDNLNLQADVASNLQILSQLFGAGVIDTKPAQVQMPHMPHQQQDMGHHHHNDPSSNVGGVSGTGTGGVSGWGSTGQMLRYDPKNSRAAENFLIRKEEEKESDSGGDEDDEDGLQASEDGAVTAAATANTPASMVDANSASVLEASSIHDSIEHTQEADGAIPASTTMIGSQDKHDTAANDNKKSTTSASSSSGDINGDSDHHIHIYHQDKLEAVFREAREDIIMPDVEQTTRTAQNPSNDNDVAKPSDKGGFAFSFSVIETESTPKQTSSRQEGEMEEVLDDSLQVGGVNPLLDSANNNNMSDNDLEMKEVEDDYGDPHEKHRKRRFARAFTDAELDSFIFDEFLMSSQFHGDRIFNDLDGWRNDESLKAQWLKERAVLTLDWKRKRKAAAARKKNTKHY